MDDSICRDEVRINFSFNYFRFQRYSWTFRCHLCFLELQLQFYHLWRFVGQCGEVWLYSELVRT
jgi:hypothetical protein